MSIGENIKSRRKDVGMSQNELASAIGVSVPMICQIERGTKIPSMESFHQPLSLCSSE